MILEYTMPEYTVSQSLIDCENHYDQLQYVYDDVIDNYGNHDNNNFINSAMEYINHLDEQIIICEHNLYDLRLKEFTYVEHYLYQLTYLKEYIKSQINTIK